jgi:hypothetical protein
MGTERRDPGADERGSAMTRRRIALLAVLGALSSGLLGCGTAAGPAIPGQSSAAPAPSTAAPAATATRATPTISAIPNTAILLVAQPDRDGWTIVEAASGGGYLGPEFRVPVGVPRSGWGRIVSAELDGDRTVVRDDVVQPGLGGPRLEVPGRWRLPTIGDSTLPVGVSSDGSTIALVEADVAIGAPTTRFAVVEHAFGGKPSSVGDADLRLARVVELRGQFAYDALSPDGRILYVIQHLDESAGGHYQVRAVDIPSGTLRPDVIVDKANPDEWMAGYPIAQIRRTDGVVMTLYDGPEHPFVHALQSAEAWALCIDLPAAAGTERSGWGLTVEPDGRTVYAANGDAGIVFELDPTEFAIRRTVTLSASAAPPITLAKFGHSDIGPIGQRVVALPDGLGLLVGRRDGVTVLNGKDLQELWTVPTGGPVDSIGVTPDESLAFALTREGRIVAFDPRGHGRALGEVPGGPYSGLIAVAPW